MIESSLFENRDNILLLKKLLIPNDERDNSSDSDYDEPPKNSLFGPAQIGPSSKPKRQPRRPPPKTDADEEKPKEDMNIDKWLEEQEKEDKDILETRKTPEYTITYKQAVGTEDVFLQMGNRTGASSSCEDMIIEIKLPEETVPVHQMDISVTDKEIDLSTPIYRLKLPLIHPINPDKSTAKYFTEKKTLRLTCRMNRELDYINF